MRVLRTGTRKMTVNRGSSKRTASTRKKLCLNRYCQQGVTLDRILNQIFAFEGEIPLNLLKKASMKEALPVFRCDICGQLSQGRLSAEGDPIPVVATPFFIDFTTQTVVYHPTVR
jgi:hypothetical protein